MCAHVMPAAVVCLLVLSCSPAGPTAEPTTGSPPAGADQETVAPPVSADAPAPDCASLDAEACAARNDCSPMRGLASEVVAALERGERPADGVPGQFFGCRSAEQGCMEVETYRTPGPGEDCYLFGDSCVPEDWKPCRPPASKPSP